MSEAMKKSGRIGTVFKGDYTSTTTYSAYDVVYQDNSSYIAKKTTTGNAPADNNENWHIFAKGGKDGISPTVSIEEEEDGYKITITDAEHSEEVVLIPPADKDSKIAERVETLEEKVPFKFTTTSVGAYGYEDEEGGFHEFGSGEGEPPKPTYNAHVQKYGITGYEIVDNSNELSKALINAGAKITDDGQKGIVNSGGRSPRILRFDNGATIEFNNYQLKISVGEYQVSLGANEFLNSTYLPIPFGFGVDDDGNYGYYKAGADTVTPFKKGVDADVGIGLYLNSVKTSTTVNIPCSKNFITDVSMRYGYIYKSDVIAYDMLSVFSSPSAQLVNLKLIVLDESTEQMYKVDKIRKALNLSQEFKFSITESLRTNPIYGVDEYISNMGEYLLPFAWSESTSKLILSPIGFTLALTI